MPATLVQEAARLSGRNITWYADNTAALSAAVKGTSREQTNRRLIAYFWMVAFRLDIRVWFEFVESDSNWADGISREYGDDLFAAKNNFSTSEFQLDLLWAQHDLSVRWLLSAAFGPKFCSHALSVPFGNS